VAVAKPGAVFKGLAFAQTSTGDSCTPRTSTTAPSTSSTAASRP
jgi:hypothetical protein